MEQAERILSIIERADGKELSPKKRAMCIAGIKQIIEETPEFDPSIVPDWVLEGLFKHLLTAIKASRN